jgi:hypothetical protein
MATRHLGGLSTRQRDTHCDYGYREPTSCSSRPVAGCPILK